MTSGIQELESFCAQISKLLDAELASSTKLEADSLTRTLLTVSRTI